MMLRAHERAAIGFLVRHMLLGVIGGLVFGVLVVAFDIAHLRTVASLSREGLPTLFLFFFSLFVTFGSLGIGVGIISLARDRN